MCASAQSACGAAMALRQSRASADEILVSDAARGKVVLLLTGVCADLVGRDGQTQSGRRFCSVNSPIDLPSEALPCRRIHLQCRLFRGNRANFSFRASPTMASPSGPVIGPSVWRASCPVFAQAVRRKAQPHTSDTRHIACPPAWATSSVSSSTKRCETLSPWPGIS